MNEPSERMARIETTLEYVKKELSDTGATVVEIRDKLDDHVLMMGKLREDIIAESDARYANKIVERLVYAVVSVLLTAFVLAIVYLIAKNPLSLLGKG